jgi:predicted protein tyrosine phosphatase
MSLLPSFLVTSRTDAGRLLASARSGGILALISIGAPDEAPCDGFYEFPGQKLRLEFDDIEMDLPWLGYRGACWEDISRLLNFGAFLPAKGTILVHCAAGISRSSASALGLLTQRLGAGREQEAVELLLDDIELALSLGWREDTILPNRRVIWMLDALLKRDGALIAAVQTRWPRHGEPSFPDGNPAVK